jgi:hypothetical protein
MLWLAARFGNEFGYDGSYDVALDSLTTAAKLAILSADLPYETEAPFLYMTLIDAGTGIVKGLRSVASSDFANVWLGAVLDQLAAPVNREEEQAWADGVAASYPIGRIHLHPRAVTSRYAGL